MVRFITGIWVDGLLVVLVWNRWVVMRGIGGISRVRSRFLLMRRKLWGLLGVGNRLIDRCS